MNKPFIQSLNFSPKTALAGDSVELTLELVLTKQFSAKGSRLVFDLPATLGSSRPTCHNQEDDGYVAVFCSNPDISYRKRCYNIELLEFIGVGSKQTHMDTDGAKRFFIIDFTDGSVEGGDRLTVKFGYIRDGMGSGLKVTTNVNLREYYNKIDVRYFLVGERAVPDLGHSVKGFARPEPDQTVTAMVRILPREPECLKLMLTKQGARLLMLDRFYNLCHITDVSSYVGGKIAGEFDDEGVFVLKKERPHLFSKGLPMTITPDFSEEVDGYRLFVGDLHTHSAYSNDCCEREKMPITPRQMFKYAQQVSCLDFVAITDHHQPWDEERNKLGIELWEDTRAAVRENDRPHSFLAFMGFEFRDNRGDTPVVFANAPEYTEIDNPALTDVQALWSMLSHHDAICIPHLHNRGSLPPDSWIECPYPGMEPIMDVCSCHGSYEWPDAQERGLPEVKRTRSDRYVQWFLQQGYTYGHSCNSDDHMGHPGSNGLTMVYARELTQEALFEAIRARRCYGTTNARIKLLLRCGGHFMGEILPQDTPRRFEIELEGEGNFKAVDLVCNGKIVRRVKPYTSRYHAVEEMKETGNDCWYLRAVQEDNHIAYSSPIWFR